MIPIKKNIISKISSVFKKKNKPDWEKSILTKRIITLERELKDAEECIMELHGQITDREGWEWAAIFQGALSTLVELKDIKDSQGKTADYEERQPKASHLAKEAIELFKQSDYGAMPLGKIKTFNK